MVDKIQEKFKKYISENIENSTDSVGLKPRIDEEEEIAQKAEILKLAKDLYVKKKKNNHSFNMSYIYIIIQEKIQVLKKSLCNLDSDIKNKVSNIKTELEFITSYEEVLHDYDDDTG